MTPLVSQKAPQTPFSVSESPEHLVTPHGLMERLFPICRSITGDGVRATLAILKEYLPDLVVHEVPSGTPALDWTVPAEWNIRAAWVKNEQGQRVIDFENHNLHVLNYSIPVQGWFTRAELDEHLFSLPEQPDLIPYRTSYYQPNWGFCLSHNDHMALPEGRYEVCVDTTLDPAGSLTYGELLLPGSSNEEVLISSHCCHPSLANDNLSGIVVATFLARHLAAQAHHYSYRFVFVPGTIGSITWLSRNRETVSRIGHGLVSTLLGGPGAFTYKKSRRSTAEIDRIVALALRDAKLPHTIRPFSPYGYDERQYCSPGFNLPVGCLSRTPFGEFPEYHTSADDLDFVRPEQLDESIALFRQVCFIIDTNAKYHNMSPYGEPQMGRRGLYKGIGGGTEGADWQMALLWILNLSDGEHTLVAIAEQANLPYILLERAAKALCASELLVRLEDQEQP